MALTDLEVRLVVRGRDLQHAGAKLNIDVLIGHDRQMRLVLHRQRPNRVFADQMPITRILRVHRNGRVARDRLRPRGRNLQPRVRFLHHLHLEIKELAVLLFHNHLFIREGGQTFRAPVHHAFAAIDKAFLVEIHKHTLHTLRVFFIHRETQARPVAARTELL